MTNAPANLLAVRSLLLAHLDDAPGPNDLEPAEVGIVGDSAHRGGYHCGSDRVDADDYSVRESTRDRDGLTLDASALDVGGFTVTTPTGTYDLRHFSRWLAGQCAARAADTRDIREVIYSPDGTTVRRWDALGKRTSGDDSHRWHTHISFFRDATKAGRDQTPLFRRYLTTIGLLGDEMTRAEFIANLRAAIADPGVAAELSRLTWAFKPADHGGETTAHGIVLNDMSDKVDRVDLVVQQMASRPPVTIDYDQLADAIVRRVLAEGSATS